MQSGISLLLITYNRPADLLHLLQTLSWQHKASEILEEVLILDNASTVSYDEIKNFIDVHPELKINFMRSAENLGVARGRNKLMETAKGDWLLVLDDDIVFVKPHDLERLAAYPEIPFFAGSNTVMFTPRVLYYDTKEVQITAFPHKNYKKYHPRDRFLAPYFIGCAHLLKRDVLAETGYYPSDFFYGMEEYDLAYRILDAGYTIGYDNAVTLEHKETPLGRQANYKKLQMQWINKSKVAWRYLPVPYFLSTAFLWSLEYMRKAKGHPGAFFSAIGQICMIPFRQKKRSISRKALQYLKQVEARLWY